MAPLFQRKLKFTADQVIAMRRDIEKEIVNKLVEGIPNSRADGWMNIITGLGTSKDKSTGMTFNPTGLNKYPDEILATMYTEDGLTDRIIGSIPDDMTRQWIHLTYHDPEMDEAQKEDIQWFMDKLTDLKAPMQFNLALRWRRLLAGAIIIMGTKDNENLENPLPKTVRDISYLQVRSRASIDTSLSLNQALNSGNLQKSGAIEKYTITPKYGTQYKVHSSRCLEFRGRQVPECTPGIAEEELYWGVSILTYLYKSLEDLSAAIRNTAIMIYEAAIGKYKIGGLKAMLSQKNGDELVKVRMNIINLAKSVMNGVILDADDNEDYSRDNLTFAGIPDIIDKFKEIVSAVSEIPVTRLFGTSPGGLNATGESDLTNYYDKVATEQKLYLQQPLQRLIDILSIIRGVDPPTVEFNSIYQLDDKEQAELEKLEAEIYKARVETEKMLLEMALTDPETSATRLGLE